MFIWTLSEPSCGEFGIHTRLAAGIPYTTGTATKTALELATPKIDWFDLRQLARSAAQQIRRDLLAGVDQTLHRAYRLVECLAVLAGQFDFDNALDTLRTDHNGHADIH